MGIDMTGFKMIYKDQVYNCLSMMPNVEFNDGQPRVKTIDVMFIGSDNRVQMVSDEAFMFQFISK